MIAFMNHELLYTSHRNQMYCWQFPAMYFFQLIHLPVHARKKRGIYTWQHNVSCVHGLAIKSCELSEATYLNISYRNLNILLGVSMLKYIFQGKTSHLLKCLKYKRKITKVAVQ